MTDTPSADPANDLQQAIAALSPELRRTQRQGLIGALAIAVVAIWAAIWFAGHAEHEAFKGVVIALGIGTGLIAWIAHMVRRHHETTLMPLLARSVGLGHRKGGRDFIAALPKRLLPRQVTSADDVLTGTVEDRAIDFAEVKVETGGKNSRTLFDGMVVTFPLKIDLPEFFIADEKETEGRFLAGPRIKVDDLTYVRSADGRSGHRYGLWSRDDLAGAEDRLILILNAISTLESRLSGDAALYTASCDGRQIHLAVRDRRNLFKIGGLFAGARDLELDIQLALNDLDVPIRLANHLLAAERDYVALGPMPTPSSGVTRQAAPDQEPDRKDDRDIG